MNQLEKYQQKPCGTLSPFVSVSDETKAFIYCAVSTNTQGAIEGAVDRCTLRLDGRNPTDEFIAEYVRIYLRKGKSPSTISIVVVAVNWVSKFETASYRISIGHSFRWQPTKTPRY